MLECSFDVLIVCGFFSFKNQFPTKTIRLWVGILRFYTTIDGSAPIEPNVNIHRKISLCIIFLV